MLRPDENQEDAVVIVSELSGEGIRTAFGAIPFVVRAFGRSEPHSHQSEETWIVREGEGYAVIDERRIRISAGDRLVIAPNTRHCVENDCAVPLAILSFWWKERHVES